MAPRSRTFDLTWQTDAACRRWPDPDAFFPDRGDESDAVVHLCARCPVQARCADQALRQRQRYGVWGGLTERDRERLWEEQARRRSAVLSGERSAS